ARDDRRGGTVHDPGRVARGDEPVLPEIGLEGEQHFERRVRSHVLVGAILDRLTFLPFHRDRHHLLLEHARIPGLLGALLRRERSSAYFAATAPSSIAERSFSVPPNAPKPVRTPERNTTSVLEPWVFIWGEAPRETRGISGGAREGGRARGPEAVEMDVVQPRVPDGSRDSAVPLKRPGQARLR